MIIVIGAPGTPEYGEQFAKWAEQWARIGKQAGATISEIGNDSVDNKNDRDRLREVITGLGNEATITQPHWLIFIGHGTFQASVAKFNLRGPDITADELAKWLKPISREIVIVNIASASGPFVNALSGTNRVIVTATKSGEEQNFARFGAYLPQALGDAGSDLDHDDEVSLLEAVLKATSETGNFYETQDRIRTEHAMVDDNGDKLGTPAELLGSVLLGNPVTVVSPTKSTAAPPRIDGDIASKTILIPATNAASLSAEELAERIRIEAELTTLRRRKSSLGEAEYFAQLEKWMLELATIYQDAEKRSKLPASSP